MLGTEQTNRGNSYSEDLTDNLGLFFLFYTWATEANNDWGTASPYSVQTTGIILFLTAPHVERIGWLLTPGTWTGKRGASFEKAQPTTGRLVGRQGKQNKMLHPGTCILKFWKQTFFFFFNPWICSSNQSVPQRHSSPGKHSASNPASAEGLCLCYMQSLPEAGNHLTYEVPVSYTQIIHLIYMYSAACLFS